MGWPPPQPPVPRVSPGVAFTLATSVSIMSRPGVIRPLANAAAGLARALQGPGGLEQ